MTVRTYVITHDYGFAPNPFGGVLSLACCKPQIRRTARIGDWVLGTLPTSKGANLLSFAAKVGEALDFTTYYERYPLKRSGTGDAHYGDAIYFRGPDGAFRWQKNIFHPETELGHDTSVDRVLVCPTFWYFGDRAVSLPDELYDQFVKRGPGHRNSDSQQALDALESFLSGYPQGLLGAPRPIVKKRVRVAASPGAPTSAPF
jgi:hypothetical protein